MNPAEEKVALIQRIARQEAAKLLLNVAMKMAVKDTQPAVPLGRGIAEAIRDAVDELEAA